MHGAPAHSAPLAVDGENTCFVRDEADDVVCSTTPADFHAVGQVFTDFHQVGDDEVRAALASPTVSAPQ